MYNLPVSRELTCSASAQQHPAALACAPARARAPARLSAASPRYLRSSRPRQPPVAASPATRARPPRPPGPTHTPPCWPAWSPGGWGPHGPAWTDIDTCRERRGEKSVCVSSESRVRVKIRVSYTSTQFRADSEPDALPSQSDSSLFALQQRRVKTVHSRLAKAPEARGPNLVVSFRTCKAIAHFLTLKHTTHNSNLERELDLKCGTGSDVRCTKGGHGPGGAGRIAPPEPRAGSTPPHVHHRLSLHPPHLPARNAPSPPQTASAQDSLSPIQPRHRRQETGRRDDPMGLAAGSGGGRRARGGAAARVGARRTSH